MDAGSHLIEEVEAVNFMSYNQFEIQFNDGINLFVGEKGSGKTSILEAIRLAFGGLGRERQDVLSDFIKKGRNECKIKVTVSNSIPTPSQRRLLPDLPRDASIVIERKLYRERSSVYKINGHRTRKYKLLDILTRIGVTPKNKLFFLPQEKVNQWVNVGQEERLEMYLRALGLLELKRKVDSLREKIREKKKERKECFEAINKWEQRAETKKRKILEPEVAQETLERYYTFKLAKLIHEREELEGNIREKRQASEEMEEQVKKLRTQLETLKEKRKKVENTREEASQKWQKLMMNKKPNYSDQKNRLEREIKQKQAQLETMKGEHKEELSEIRKVKEKWHIEEIDEIQDLIRERKKRIKEIEEKLLMESEYKKIQKMETELEDLNYKKEKLHRQFKKHREKLKSLLKKMGRPALRKVLSNLLENDLITENANERKFFGPLGLEIEVTKPISKAREYSFALENGLGETFFSFLALDTNAYERLNEMCKKIKNGHRVRIYTINPKQASTASLKEVIRRGERRREELIETGREKLGIYEGSIAAWLPELIDAPLPVKALIEVLNWDVPIVTGISVAKEIAKNLGLRKVVTLDGVTMERVHNDPTEVGVKVHRPPLRSHDTSILDKALGFTIGDFLHRERTIKEKIDELQAKIKDKKNAIERAKEHLPLTVQQLLKRQTQLEKEITELKEDESTLERLKRKRERKEEKRERIKRKITQLRSKIDEIADEIEEIDHRIDELREKERNMVEKKEELKETRESKFRKLERLKGKIEDMPLLLNALEKEKKSKTEEIKETKKEILGFMEMLKRFEVYPNKDIQDLLEERVLKPMREIQEMDIGTIREVLGRLEKYSEDYRQAIQETEEKMKEVQRMEEKAEDYREKIREVEEEKDEIEKLCEKETQELLSKIREKTKIINRNYQRIIGYLDANGEISIQGKHVENLALQATIDLHRDVPAPISEGGFSSGEKTIAIMSLIIAVLLTSPAPIYIWDEFEVFLDNRSLKSVITIIKNALSDHQGILTTTHREALIRAADKVFYTEYEKEEKKSKILPLTLPKRKQLKELNEFGVKWRLKD